MRLIVGRDYYDNALAYGRDDAVTFVRSREDMRTNDQAAHGLSLLTPFIEFGIILSDFTQPRYNKHRYRNDINYFSVVEHRNGYDTTINYSIRPIKVVFCGKEYNGVKVTDFSVYKSASHYFWTLDSLQEWLSKYNLVVKEGVNHSYMYSYGSNKINSVEYFTPRAVSSQTLDKLIENKITIVTYDWDPTPFHVNNTTPWQVNGDNLKEIGFYKIIDAFTAFQEISMWVGGVLPASSNKMVEISNSDKIHKHGFDKFSFRKAKTIAK